MNKKNDTLALFFITIVTILIWVFAASQNKIEKEMPITLGFQSPEGSTIRFTPDSKLINLTLSGTKLAVDRAVKVLVSETPKLTLGPNDIEEPLDLLTKLNALDSISRTGAEVSSVKPQEVTLTSQTMAKTQKTTLVESVQVLIAQHTKYLGDYKLTLPRTHLSKVMIGADADVIEGIKSGDVDVFAIVRLATSDLEQGITEKPVTIFLAIMEDGTGRELVATIEDPSLLDIELKIEKIEQIEE